MKHRHIHALRDTNVGAPHNNCKHSILTWSTTIDRTTKSSLNFWTNSLSLWLKNIGITCANEYVPWHVPCYNRAMFHTCNWITAALRSNSTIQSLVVSSMQKQKGKNLIHSITAMTQISMPLTKRTHFNVLYPEQWAVSFPVVNIQNWASGKCRSAETKV